MASETHVTRVEKRIVHHGHIGLHIGFSKNDKRNVCCTRGVGDSAVMWRLEKRTVHHRHIGLHIGLSKNAERKIRFTHGRVDSAPPWRLSEGLRGVGDMEMMPVRSG